MPRYLSNRLIFATCFGVSVIVHLLMLMPMERFAHVTFVGTVNPIHAFMVDLTKSRSGGAPAEKTVRPQYPPAIDGEQEVAEQATHGDAPGSSSAVPGKESAASVPIPSQDGSVGRTDDGGAGNDATIGENVSQPSRDTVPVHSIKPPLRDIGEFLMTDREKFFYSISMYGVSVGHAEMEAKRDRGEIRITLKVTSAPAISAVYPVDDLVETRHIGGNFILTRIRQQEGSFRSDRGFTIMLREKKVFWIDRLRNRSLTEPIPNDQVLDLISGLYYLRNRPLEVGRTELLQVYDSDTYAQLPVEVLRRERLQLPGLGPIDTLVIKPLLKTDGIFQRTGEVTIWLTDDEFRAPVKVETRIPLGTVTAELVSAE